MKTVLTSAILIYGLCACANNQDSSIRASSVKTNRNYGESKTINMLKQYEDLQVFLPFEVRTIDVVVPANGVDPKVEVTKTYLANCSIKESKVSMVKDRAYVKVEFEPELDDGDNYCSILIKQPAKQDVTITFSIFVGDNSADSMLKDINLLTNFTNVDAEISSERTITIEVPNEGINPNIKFDSYLAYCAIQSIKDISQRAKQITINFEPELDDGYNGCKILIVQPSGKKSVVDVYVDVTD